MIEMRNLTSLFGKFLQRKMGFFAILPFAYTFLKLAHNVIYPKLSKLEIEAEMCDTGNFDWLIIVPPSMHASKIAWEPASGNYFYEIWKTATELSPDLRIVLHFVEPNDTNWLRKIIADVKCSSPSRIMFQCEEQINGDPRSIELLCLALGQSWQGELLAIMYDSVYWWHTIKFDRYVKHFPNLGILAIDAFPSKNKSAAFRIGPAVLPTSRATLTFLDELASKSVKRGDAPKTTFIGAIYPYRRKLIDSFLRLGIPLDVNPHKSVDDVHPTYIDYCLEFYKSWGTINLSRSNGMPFRHIKTRVLEAPMFGAILFTDNRSLPVSILSPNSYVKFRSARDLRSKIRKMELSPDRVELMRFSAKLESESLRVLFWTSIFNHYSKSSRI